MKQKLLKIGLIAFIVLVTAVNSGFLAYQLTRTSTTKSSKTTVAPLAKLQVKSAKQVDISSSAAGVLAGTGSYSVESLSKSRVDTGDGSGKLVLASYEPLGAHFILATGKDITLDSSKIKSDWQATTVSTDGLWAPAACSAKPTLLFQGRYIFIDDGKTKATDTYNSYLSYDIQTGKYNYFGGDSFTDIQAKREKIMLATNENDKLVFYVDVLDGKGSLASSNSFKHSAANGPGYIIRRVIDPGTMQYSDYHIPYSLPQGTQYYYLNTLAATTTSPVSVLLSGDSNGLGYAGSVINNKINFEKQNNVEMGNASARPLQPPYDTELEKKYNDALTAALPGLGSGEKYVAVSYTTNFGINELGSHNTSKFVIAASRNGEQDQTPAVLDGSNAYPMTDTPMLNYGVYVPLGVY